MDESKDAGIEVVNNECQTNNSINYSHGDSNQINELHPIYHIIIIFLIIKFSLSFFITNYRTPRLIWRYLYAIFNYFKNNNKKY